MTFALSPSLLNALKYTGDKFATIPAVNFPRAPTTTDFNYPLFTLWRNSNKLAVFPDAEGDMWYLAKLSPNGTGHPLAIWIKLSAGIVSDLKTLSDTANTTVSPGVSGNIQLVGANGVTVTSDSINHKITISNGVSAFETLTGNDSVAVNPSAGTINVVGNTVANGTHDRALYTKNTIGNTESFDIQVSAAIPATNIAKAGVSAFNSSQFSVDGNGFVSLSGGVTPPTLGMVPDAHTAPGTSPVNPNGSGNITLEGGSTFAAGTQANPIRTNSLAANTVDLQIQLAGSSAGTAGANFFGVSQFDSNQFTVSSGFVQLKGGGTAPALTKIATDAGASPAVPDATGDITLTGAQVAAGTIGANVLRSNTTGPSTVSVQIQRATTSALSDSTKNGVAHFNSAQFSVDANGFVGLTAFVGAFPWTDEGLSFSAASNNGYFCTALLTATLPATPSQGDVIKFVMDTASVVTISANTGQKIRLGSAVSAATGTCKSSKQGDSINLVYRTADATWLAYSSIGTWTVT